MNFSCSTGMLFFLSSFTIPAYAFFSNQLGFFYVYND